MEDVLQDLYKCKICGKKSQHLKKLKCQHSFCKDCLVTYISTYCGSAYFPCPTCSYKHVANDPETEVGEHVLLELEEDCLSRDLQQFYKNDDKRDDKNEIPGNDVSNNLACTTHSGSIAEYYCQKCNTVVCELCRHGAHAHWDSLQNIEESLTKATNLKCIQVLGLFEDVHSRAELVKDKLKRKIAHLNQENECVGKVQSYFANLKEKIIRCLDLQEQKVLAKAKAMQKMETNLMQTDMTVCESVVASLSQFEDLIKHMQIQVSNKPAQNMILANHLESTVLAYNNMLPQIETEAQKSVDLHLVINTEQENVIFGSDIVKIEVTGSSVIGSGRGKAQLAGIRVQDVPSSTRNNEASTVDVPQTMPVREDRPSARNVASSAVLTEHPASVATREEAFSRTTLTRDTNSPCTLEIRERTVPSAPPDLDSIPPPDEEEPPPSYSSVVNQCFAYDLPSSWSSQSDHSSASVHQNVGVTNITPAAVPSAPPLSSGGGYRLPSPLHMTTRQRSPTGKRVSSPIRNKRDFNYPTSAPSSSPFAHLVANLPKHLRHPPVTGIEGFKFRLYVDTKLPREKNRPYLVGIARIKDYFVVLDQANNCLKLLKGTATLRDVFSFEEDVHPTGVVAISDIECVVTVPNQEKLIFLSYDKLPRHSDAHIRKVIRAGPYESLAYDKSRNCLIGARVLPTAGVEFFDMEGGLIQRIIIHNPSAIIRNMVMTDNDMLIMCDLHKRQALYVANTKDNNHTKIFTGSRTKRIQSPQGMIALPGRGVILITDGANGDVFVTSYSLAVRTVHDYVIRMCLPGDPEFKYTLSSTKNDNTIVVAFTHGIVSYYDVQSA